MPRFSTLAALATFTMVAAIPVSDAHASIPADRFTHIEGTIFEKLDTDGDGVYGEPGEGFRYLILADVADDLENATDTSVPPEHFFPVVSPCLNRISHVLDDWISTVAGNAGIYVPGDGVPDGEGGTDPFEVWLVNTGWQSTYEQNFFELLMWSVEESEGHHGDCDFTPGGGSGGGPGGGSGGGIGEGSGGGFNVNPDPDPIEEVEEWDIDDFDDFFEEEGSDCKETVRWLMSMAMVHYPDGGSSPDGFGDESRRVFDGLCPCDGETINDFSTCPAQPSVAPVCGTLPGDFACEDSLFGNNPTDCHVYAAKIAYTEIYENYTFATCDPECDPGDGSKNQRIRDLILIELEKGFEQAKIDLPLPSFTRCPLDCETANNFSALWEGFGVPMSGADYDFLNQLGDCGGCAIPTLSTPGLLIPDTFAGHMGTGSDTEFECDRDGDGSVTPMDALLFARSTMRGDEDAADPGLMGMAIKNTSPCDDGTGAYGAYFQAYSKYDWADQFLINAEKEGCGPSDCADRDEFIQDFIDLFDRHRDELDLPPDYDPLPPGMEEWTRPRTIPDGVPYGGIIYEDGTTTHPGGSPCPGTAPEKPLKSKKKVPETDESEGEVEDVDEATTETCPPSEETPEFTVTDTGGSRAAPVPDSGDPIRLSTGEKIESAVDLVIPLAGKDFRLVRNYRSFGPELESDDSTPTDFDGLTGGGHVGNQWDLPLSMWVDEEYAGDGTTPRVTLHSASGPLEIRLASDGNDVWGRWRSQRTQRFIAAWSPAIDFDGEPVAGKYIPVWRLVEPGSYTLEFYRGHTLSGAPTGSIYQPEDHEAGLLLRRIEPYGNIWQFIYDDYFVDNSGTVEAVDSRPIGIRFLRAPASGLTVPTPMAELQLEWDGREFIDVPGTDPDIENPNYGRLREARVMRFEPGEFAPSVVTQRVLYTYYTDYYAGSGTEPYSSDLGSDGDLIQVTKLTRVDGETPDDELWRTEITQYRYHKGTYSTSGELDLSMEDPWTLYGHKHALKAVIYPQQVERFAHDESSPASMQYIGDAAKTLLGMDDFSSGSNRLALEWAGKVVTKYEPVFSSGSTIDYSQPFRVREQILSAGCGCGSSADTDTRYTYDYHDLRSTVTTPFTGEELVWSAHVTEWNLDDPNWVAQTAMLYDFVQFTDTDEMLRLQHAVLAAPLDGATGSLSGADFWVTRYEFDRRNLPFGSGTLPRDSVKAILYPSAMSSYDPADEDATPNPQQPTYAAYSSEGLVMAFDHNIDGRLTGEWVREGWSPISDSSDAAYNTSLNAYTQLREIQRPAISDMSNYFRGFSQSITEALPERETFFADTGGTVEEEIEYGFSFAASGFSVGQRLVGVALISRAPSAAQNGSGSAAIADASRSVVFLDDDGEIELIIEQNDSLTHYARQDSTGLVTSITKNADATLHPLPSSTWIGTNPALSGFSGRNTDGGSLTTSIARDYLGRITTITSPAGVMSSIVRSIEPWQHTNPSAATPHDYSYYSETVLPHVYDDSSGQPVVAGSASRTWYDAGGLVLGSESYLIDAASADDEGTQELLARDSFRFEFEFLGIAVSRSVTQRSRSGLVELTAVWPDLSAYSGSLANSGTVAEPVRPRATAFTYDYRGNLVETQFPDGSIQSVVFDILDRPTEIALGSDSDPTAGNMTTVRRMWYDSDGAGGLTTSGVGDGYLTFVRESPTGNSADDRETEMRYDYRGRLVTVINPTTPHSHFQYDNRDRVVAAILFDETAGATSGLNAPNLSARLSDISYSYDSRGQLYRRSVKIDPTNAASGTLDAFAWFDKAGQWIATQSPSAPKVKTRYDGLGRSVSSYFTTDTSEINPTVSGSYADTYDALSYSPNLTGDIVFEQTDYDYIQTGVVGFGKPELVTHRLRLHGALSTTTGGLDQVGVSSINTYTGFYYDGANRLVHSVDFGTNDPASTDRFIADTGKPSINQGDADLLYDNIPVAVQDALVASRRFDARGRLSEGLGPWRTEALPNPTRKRSLVFYNDLNETVGVIENAVDSNGTPEITWSASTLRYEPVASQGDYSPQRSRATSFNRNLIGQISERMAWRDDSHSASDGNVQITSYEYQHDIGAELVTTDLKVNWLLRRVNYPDEDPTTSSPDDAFLNEDFGYNLLGELVVTADQNRTQRDYARDKRGRITLDVASAIDSGSGIDGSIRALQYTYDSAGRLRKVTSHSDVTPSGANTVNAMQYTYDSLWRVVQLQQNPLGDIAANATTGIVDFDYEDAEFDASKVFGTHNVNRATDLSYPLGAQGASAARTVVTDLYGTTGGIDDVVARTTGYEWNRGTSTTTHGVAVERLGFASPVKITYSVPDLALDRIQADPTTIINESDIDEYKGLDRFGRITSQMWIEPGRIPVADQKAVALGYEYNSIGLITERLDERLSPASNFRNEEFEFDGLDRLTKRLLTPSGADTYQTDWSLDTFGNWDTWTINEDPDATDSTYALNDDRVVGVNGHNESNELVQHTVNGVTKGLAYDDAGNLTEQDLSATASRVFVYDAWNRLVQVAYDTGSGAQNRVQYRYYPTGERAASLVDTDIAAGFLPDELNLFFYDAAWRLLEIRSDKTGSSTWSFPASTASFTLSNTRQFIWGEQYVDELVAYMSDTKAAINPDGTLLKNPSFARLDYALTDRNFSVIGMGYARDQVGDRVRYDPYGTFAAYPSGDVNLDGAVDGADTTAIMIALNYEAELDVNMDAVIDSKDSSAVGKLAGRSFGPGRLTDTGNIVGWCGYLYEEATGMWLARRRWQIPELGRWANRDPLGYAGGGQNTYEYVNGMPIAATDPLGLAKGDPGEGPIEVLKRKFKIDSGGQSTREKNHAPPNDPSKENRFWFRGKGYKNTDDIAKACGLELDNPEHKTRIDDLKARYTEHFHAVGDNKVKFYVNVGEHGAIHDGKEWTYLKKEEKDKFIETLTDRATKKNAKGKSAKGAGVARKVLDRIDIPNARGIGVVASGAAAGILGGLAIADNAAAMDAVLNDPSSGYREMVHNIQIAVSRGDQNARRRAVEAGEKTARMLLDRGFYVQSLHFEIFVEDQVDAELTRTIREMHRDGAYEAMESESDWWMDCPCIQ